MGATVRPGAMPGSRRQRRRLSPNCSPSMKLLPLLARFARLALVAIAAGVMLSACAAAQPDGPGDCVGPPDFCVPFFGS